ncbi:hypothetical protein SAMN02983003_0118 [Devosia enhydra]|uniref:Uncharacterized protein n=1 Tax=Devosia enhydra TaxID=665118 RepID=A0A1K2HT00_9HYPH|nr:hypothetical protein SAMN02983003_0118 [Devosia enhydra]
MCFQPIERLAGTAGYFRVVAVIWGRQLVPAQLINGYACRSGKCIGLHAQ